MMDFELIETRRLLLKGLSPEGMKYIFENLEIPEIKKILGHQSDEDFRKEEYKFKNGYASYNRTFVTFLMEDKASGKIIGRCGIHNWDKEQMHAEIGYIMHDEQFRRKGLMTEAVSAVLEYSFIGKEINRIEALGRIGNEASVRILETFNFKREGILRRYFYSSGVFEDAVLFSILSEEYSVGRPEEINR